LTSSISAAADLRVPRTARTFRWPDYFSLRADRIWYSDLLL